MFGRPPARTLKPQTLATRCLRHRDHPVQPHSQRTTWWFGRDGLLPEMHTHEDVKYWGRRQLDLFDFVQQRESAPGCSSR